MPRRSTLFQRAVFQIQRQLAADASVEESALLPDSVHGGTREVDVVVRGRVGEHDVVVSIECRQHKRPATIGWVEEMAMKHASLPTSKLVLLASAGFSKAAKHKAEMLGIEALSLEEAVGEDWTWIESNQLEVWALRIRGCNLGFDAEKLWFSAPSGLAIFRPDGTFRGSVEDVVRAHLEGLPEFSESAIEHARRSGHSEFWAECDSEPPFVIKDSHGLLHTATSIHVRVQTVCSPGAINLTKGRIKNSAVAFGHGQSPAGELTFSLVRAHDSSPKGTVSVVDAQTKRIHTIDVTFTPEQRKLQFVAGPVRVRNQSDENSPNKK